MEQQKVVEQLCRTLIRAKKAEAKAKEKRLVAEATLLAAIPSTVIKLEGVSTINTFTSHFKITIINKLNRELNFPTYEALNLPENLQFVSFEPKIDLKRLRAVEMVDPKLVASCITTKPAKTSVKVEEVV